MAQVLTKMSRITLPDIAWLATHIEAQSCYLTDTAQHFWHNTISFIGTPDWRQQMHKMRMTMVIVALVTGDCALFSSD